jgi:hypothetical protein
VRIYIAGPYTAPTVDGRLANTNRAIEVGLALMRLGHQPFIPHLSHFMDTSGETGGTLFPYERWLELDNAWLDQSEALYFIAPSRGASLERARAERLGLPVYERLQDVPPAP